MSLRLPIEEDVGDDDEHADCDGDIIKNQRRHDGYDSREPTIAAPFVITVVVVVGATVVTVVPWVI
jgi:hypothetical protein